MQMYFNLIFEQQQISYGDTARKRGKSMLCDVEILMFWNQARLWWRILMVISIVNPAFSFYYVHL